MRKQTQLALDRIKAIDIERAAKLSEADLKKLVQSTARVLNEQLNRLYKAGSEYIIGKTGDKDITKLWSPAYDKVMKEGGLFTTVADKPRIDKGELTWDKTRNQLIRELNREIEFATSTTSTLEGARAEEQRRRQVLEDTLDTKGMTKAEIDKMTSEAWDEYIEWRESHPAMYQSDRGMGNIKVYKEWKASQEKQPDQNKISPFEQRKREEIDREQKTYEEIARKNGANPNWDNL